VGFCVLAGENMNIGRHIFVIVVGVMFLNLTSLTFADTKSPKMEEVTTRSGYVTAIKYLEMPKLDRTIYVMGFFDGLSAAPIIVSTEAFYQDWFNKMFDKKITNHQLEAVITEYLRKHPYKWQEPLNGLIYRALFEAFAEKSQGQ
jgi:hypothetical protein